LPLRVLTCRDGLFYAGQLCAITPPDVYGITIDGERGHKPEILSREEILKDTIREVKPRLVLHWKTCTVEQLKLSCLCF